MLTTLLRPTEGSLFLAGHDVNKEQDSARKVFGIVFQDPSLDDELTAFENMQLHAVLYGLDAVVAARKATQPSWPVIMSAMPTRLARIASYVLIHWKRLNTGKDDSPKPVLKAVAASRPGTT